MINDPAAYFLSFGLFHDAWLTGLRWDCDKHVIELAINDYRAGIDEDDVPSDVQGGLVFSGVADLRGALNDSSLWISEFVVQREGVSWQAKLVLNSGATLTWTFKSVAELDRLK
jgi:hypothetical protein